MKLRLLFPVFTAGLIILASSGCAFMSKGTTQVVAVRSVPEGATGFVNDVEVGKTPFKIKLKRTNTAIIELRKNGFENASVVVTPVANEFAKRYIRLGLDYKLGGMTDLTPSDIKLPLYPVLALEERGDPYKEMSLKVLKADAMLATKEITPTDHKDLVDHIINFYTK